MRNPNKQQQQPQDQQEEDSWEVRAFAEDTGNNITWPPRSYTCTFCRREFRSAQALGGHMNVHRRDRARLHSSQVVLQPNSTSSSASTSSFIIPAHEFVANTTATGTGLCFVYRRTDPNSSRDAFTPTITTTESSPSTLLSISNFPTTNLISTARSPAMNFPVSRPPEIDASRNNSQYLDNNYRAEEPTTSLDKGDEEDIDLELRLGQSPIAPT